MGKQSRPAPLGGDEDLTNPEQRSGTGWSSVLPYLNRALLIKPAPPEPPELDPQFTTPAPLDPER